MPGITLRSQEVSDLIWFLRTLRPRGRRATLVRKKVQTTDGKTIEGLVLGESGLDMDIRSDDQQIHLLRVAANNLYRPVRSQLDWPTYNGQMNGNRLAKLRRSPRTMSEN